MSENSNRIPISPLDASAPDQKTNPENEQNASLSQSVPEVPELRRFAGPGLQSHDRIAAKQAELDRIYITACLAELFQGLRDQSPTRAAAEQILRAIEERAEAERRLAAASKCAYCGCDQPHHKRQ